MIAADYATGRADRNLKWGERCATHHTGMGAVGQHTGNGPRLGTAWSVGNPLEWVPGVGITLACGQNTGTGRLSRTDNGGSQWNRLDCA